MQLFQLILEPQLDRPLTRLQVGELPDFFENFFQLIDLELDLVTELIEPIQGALLRVVFDVFSRLGPRSDIFKPCETLQHVLDLSLLATELLLEPLEVLDEGLVSLCLLI